MASSSSVAGNRRGHPRALAGTPFSPMHRRNRLILWRSPCRSFPCVALHCQTPPSLSLRYSAVHELCLARASRSCERLKGVGFPTGQLQQISSSVLNLVRFSEITEDAHRVDDPGSDAPAFVVRVLSGQMTKVRRIFDPAPLPHLPRGIATRNPAIPHPLLVFR